MGLLQQFKPVSQTQTSTAPKAKRRRGGHGWGDQSASDAVSDEIDRLEKYIDDEYKSKIIDESTALKYGVENIGTQGDTAGVLGDMVNKASLQAKRQAAKYLSEKYALENLKEVIATKTKNVVGKLVSKNIYIKEVRYTRAGVEMSYIQARNIKTGRVVSMKAAKMLLAKAN